MDDFVGWLTDISVRCLDQFYQIFDTLLYIRCMTGITHALVNLLYKISYVAVSSVNILSLQPSANITIES